MEKKRNLWVIPTDKPSRLYKTGNFLLLDSKSMPNNTLETINQNINITSDEEIEKGDFYTYEGKFVLKSDGGFKKGLQKIILTTDPDLINEGVQAIEDKFLEWFVKNPSCEFVEVKQKQHFEADKSKRINPLNGVYYSYKIIIPQEEPIESDNIDAQWLSPTPSEREWQEKKLIEIFGHYPNACPRWQYLNGLIHIALEYIELNKEEV
jgi:hypothetical protein